MSGNLPVILLGVTQLGLFGSLLVAIAAAISQSYTSGKNKTKAIQFVFNACTLMNATGLAYLAYHSQMLGITRQRTPCPWCWPRLLTSWQTRRR